MVPNRPGGQTKYSEQNIANTSFDEDFGVGTHEPLGFDGQNLQRQQANALSSKTTIVGALTYVAIAAPGTAQATAKWQCKKIDETTGIVVTWADGNANFDNVATDLTALTYS